MFMKAGFLVNDQYGKDTRDVFNKGYVPHRISAQTLIPMLPLCLLHICTNISSVSAPQPPHLQGKWYPPFSFAWLKKK